MFSEKTNLVEKKGSPFYGSYKETNNVLEEIHWQNKKKQRQLLIVTIVVLALTLLGVGIVLAITLPPLLDKNASRSLDPPNPVNLTINSTSTLERYTRAAVSSEDDRCSDLGRQVMQNNNGTAVDAAIVVALCHGVVAPQSSGLGGGLFMSVYSDGKMYALNSRERAPQAIDEEDFAPDSLSANVDIGVPVAVPGELAGLWAAHQKFGQTPWQDLVKLVQDYATEGFFVSKHLAEVLLKNKNILLADPVLKSEFIDAETGEPMAEGDVVKRPLLAATLGALAEGGATAFYNGTLAAQIVQEITQRGGFVTAEDLSQYTAEWVEPIVVKFKNNLTMFTLPFPSSGPVMALALNILDGFGKLEGEPTQIDNGVDHHRLIEVLKFASTHRAQISDPDFDESGELNELLQKMLSNEYADELRAKIGDYRTSTDPKYYGAVYASTGDNGTAHISIIGPNGDAVSLTTTINTAFGARFAGNLTGIIYNDEMLDFTFPNKTDVYGLPRNPKNNIQPGKQPASSMSPLIFLNADGEPVLVTGGSGGVDIVPAIISTTWGALYRNMDIKEAIDYPRFEIQFNNTDIEVFYEYGFPSYLISDLERKGQRTQRHPLNEYTGCINSVCMTKLTEEILGNADYRKGGGVAGF